MISKTITSNGIYNAADDNADAFSVVTVSIPYAGLTATKTITSNGTYSASDDGVNGYTAVTVDIHENIVVDDITISSNGTYNAADDDIDAYSKVVVDLPSNMVGITVSSNGNYFAANSECSGFSQVVVSLSVPNIISEYTVSSNGTYSASALGYSAFANVMVNVPSDDLNKYIEGKTSYYVGSLSRYDKIFAFASFHSLTRVELYAVTYMGNSMFYDCENLRYILLSPGSSCSIPHGFAYGCTSLTSVVISHPINATSDEIIVMGTSSCFRTTPIRNSSYTGAYGSIYIYPPSLVSAYRAASGWSDLSSRITAYTGA